MLAAGLVVTVLALLAIVVLFFRTLDNMRMPNLEGGRTSTPPESLEGKWDTHLSLMKWYVLAGAGLLLGLGMLLIGLVQKYT